MILRKNMPKLTQNHDPTLGKQLDFWMESAKLLEKEMEIWEETGNVLKYDQTVERMNKVLGILQELIDQLNDETGEEKP